MPLHDPPITPAEREYLAEYGQKNVLHIQDIKRRVEVANFDDDNGLWTVASLHNLLNEAEKRVPPGGIASIPRCVLDRGRLFLEFLTKETAEEADKRIAKALHVRSHLVGWRGVLAEMSAFTADFTEEENDAWHRRRDRAGFGRP